jgi:LAGLIDADG endonuclease
MNKNYNNKLLGHSSALVSETLTPGFVTGLADGEGSFGIYLQKTPQNQQTGYQVKYEFTIVLHNRDRALLEKVQLFFKGIGGIDKHGKSSSKYRVSSIKDISIIIDHFDKYPLLTKKRANYLLFKKAYDLVVRKQHNTPEGFRELLSIKAAINLGLPDSLKAAFPDIIPVGTPIVEDNTISDPN